MSRRARPGRQLLRGRASQAARAVPRRRVPWAAVAGSRACPVVMTACSCRKIAAAMTVCASAGVSLFCSLLVRYWYRAP